MKKTEKGASSYLDTIGSGFESKTVEEGKPQIGKAHEEEVAKSNNWTGDKRDEIGRAAAMKLARKLRRIAAEVEAFSEEYMDDEYAEDIKETAEDMKDEVEEKQTGPGGHVPDGSGPHGRGMGPGKGLGDGSGMPKSEASKNASHPTVNPNDKPDGEMDVRTGDEWIDVTMEDWKNDKRDPVGKAL